jgi:signal transduction histidine kinase
VTVLRAGLDELLTSDALSPEQREAIDDLVHQTFRLTNIIEDLLLLSRMDAGRLRLEFEPVNLNRLIEAWLDDLSAIPEGPDVAVELDLPEAFEIAGEKRYTSLIVQNLLVNARKYNRPGGEIRITGDEDGEWAVLTIANTGRPIPPAAQAHIFERFHRGTMAENVPGHGLGLNLARELVRLHHGELRLVRSDEEWTVFEVRFRLAHSPPVAALAVA